MASRLSAPLVRRLSALLVLWLAACGEDPPFIPIPAGDTGVDGAANAGEDRTRSDAAGGRDADDATAADTISEPDGAPEPGDATEPDVRAEPTVTFTLTNANPGGLSRWVQIESNIGVPGWWSILRAGTSDEFIRAHHACTLCDCDDPDCVPCAPAPEILEIRPGESVTGEWAGQIWSIVQTPTVCQEPAERLEDDFIVEFVWSPVPPDDTGVLPPGTLSRTRAPFTLTDGAVVTYELEALAEP